ncbi:uncharacterized protein G2W53_026391 [Senna tora]|uniref:Uncharacterized protein n=1 Tax=Senna tora TaxID=362788 RepID=A0A834TGX3_9FABA|nr:uncharacterized protein G2W53_026391 [Senna tora]
MNFKIQSPKKLGYSDRAKTLDYAKAHIVESLTKAQKTNIRVHDKGQRSIPIISNNTKSPLQPKLHIDVAKIRKNLGEEANSDQILMSSEENLLQLESFDLNVEERLHLDTKTSNPKPNLSLNFKNHQAKSSPTSSDRRTMPKKFQATNCFKKRDLSSRKLCGPKQDANDYPNVWLSHGISDLSSS